MEKYINLCRRLSLVSSPNCQLRTTRPELCTWQSERGSCFGQHLRWFYSTETSSCTSFMYSGCDGNANRFTSLEGCQRACGEWRETGTVTYSTPGLL